MNQFLVLISIILVCGYFYMVKQQPEQWNSFLDSIMVPGAGGAPPYPTKAAAANAATRTPSAPIFINPSSNLINSAHVKNVAQPVQDSARVFVPPNPLPAQDGWVWTTSDGRTFRSVVIQKVEADRVTIFHDSGTAVVEINLLPNFIAKQLNYDPELAMQAHIAREQDSNDAAAQSVVPATSTSGPAH